MEEDKAAAVSAKEATKSADADGEAKAAEPSAADDVKDTAADDAPSKAKEPTEAAKGDDAAADEKKADDSSEKAKPDAEKDDAAQKDESNEKTTDDKDKKDESKAEPMEEEEETKEDAAEEAVPAVEEVPVELPNPSGRARRARKSTEVYQPAEEKKKKEKEIPKGKGEKLEDMPRVVGKFKDVTWSDPHLKMLYSIVFGRGQKKEFKGHLLQFNGVVYPEGKEEDEQERLKEKMYKLTMPELKAVMDLVDIDRSETSGKEPHCQLFLEWLEEPKGSGKKVQNKTPGKRKSSGSAKGSAKKEPAKKAKKTAAKPAKETAAKPAKKTAAKPAKKVSAEKKPAAKASKAKKAAKGGGVDLNIPGVDIDKVREKVKTIVDNANREELTVKGVRKMLEDWLDTDLSDHKDAVRSIVMEVM